MSGNFRDEGIVLRTRKLSESDRIATIATRHNGKISVVVKSSRKLKSRYGACFEPFMHINAEFALGRNLDYAVEAEIVDAFGKCFAIEYEKYFAASQMVEILDKLLSEVHEPAEQQYLLLLRAMKMLSTKLEDPIGPNVISLSYALRCLALSGWELDPQNLAASGIKQAPKMPLEDFEDLLEGLLSGNWQALAKILGEHQVEDELTKIIAKYTVHHLEKHLKTFSLT
ncbi:MAG: DNA repair protein RecO [Candidatus Ancillula sp.]|jgi:DNA repair protein RecO (recombination protein O)|nr:DNA repair protein RecO [Candidatus Ancillula sp.]